MLMASFFLGTVPVLVHGVFPKLLDNGIEINDTSSGTVGLFVLSLHQPLNSSILSTKPRARLVQNPFITHNPNTLL